MPLQIPTMPLQIHNNVAVIAKPGEPISKGWLVSYRYVGEGNSAEKFFEVDLTSYAARVLLGVSGDMVEHLKGLRQVEVDRAFELRRTAGLHDDVDTAAQAKRPRRAAFDDIDDHDAPVEITIKLSSGTHVCTKIIPHWCRQAKLELLFNEASVNLLFEEPPGGKIFRPNLSDGRIKWCSARSSVVAKYIDGQKMAQKSMKVKVSDNFEVYQANVDKMAAVLSVFLDQLSAGDASQLANSSTPT